MSIKVKLSIINFLQFFAWGSWLLSAGAYMGGTLHFTGVQIGSVYATLGIASLFMPTLAGIVADRWISPRRVFGVSHILVAVLLFLLSRVNSYTAFYAIMFAVSIFYVPTLSLNNAIAFGILTKNKEDVIKAFPPIRVIGTVGFIIAAWGVDLLNWKLGHQQFLMAACASLLLSILSFILPKYEKDRTTQKSSGVKTMDAIKSLFVKKHIVVFFLFTILLGSILQITNIWGVPFLDDFKVKFPDSFAARYPVILLTLSQISEVVFILLIPKLYHKLGIKQMTLTSMVAWVFRFGLFAIAAPQGYGLIFLISSMIVYGMAFDFFNISGSMFIEKESTDDNRAASQGIFALTTGGIGPMLGGYLSGLVVDHFTDNGLKDWPAIWIAFAAYSLFICILFSILFKYKETSNK